MLQHTIDERGVVTLTLDRPQLHNAFDDTLIAELIKVLALYKAHSHCRLLVLRANGKSFSAGADLNWMQRVAQYTQAENKADAENLAELMSSLYYFPHPTIAVVQGAAFGGGVGLVSCCDIAVASDKASFCLSEVKLGLVPAVISPYVIAAIGARQAQRYFLSAERFDAQTAYHLGLVQQLCTAEELDNQTTALINTILSNAPIALTACKQLIQQVHTSITPELRDYTTSLIAQLRVSPEGQEGLAAFLEKRPAGWLK